MMLHPVPGNIDAPCHPHTVMGLDMIKKTLQRAEAAGAAKQPAVHPHREHLGRLLAFGIEHIEGIAQISKEMLGSVEALGRGEAHIVAIQGVRHDQVVMFDPLAIGRTGPERQVITVVVAVVEKAAFVEHQPPGIGAVAAGIPTLRLLPIQALKDFDGSLHVLTLNLLGHLLVVNPAVAVTGNLVTQLLEGMRHLGVTLQRHGHTKDRQRQAPTLKFTQNAPHTGTGAILIDGLHAQVAVGISSRSDDLGEELLGAGITMQHAVLAALFVVEDKLYGYFRASRPVGMGRGTAVADKITGVIRTSAHHYPLSFLNGITPTRRQSLHAPHRSCQSCCQAAYNGWPPPAECFLYAAGSGLHYRRRYRPGARRSPAGSAAANGKRYSAGRSRAECQQVWRSPRSSHLPYRPDGKRAPPARKPAGSTPPPPPDTPAESCPHASARRTGESTRRRK